MTILLYVYNYLVYTEYDLVLLFGKLQWEWGTNGRILGVRNCLSLFICHLARVRSLLILRSGSEGFPEGEFLSVGVFVYTCS